MQKVYVLLLTGIFLDSTWYELCTPLIFLVRTASQVWLPVMAGEFLICLLRGVPFPISDIQGSLLTFCLTPMQEGLIIVLEPTKFLPAWKLGNWLYIVLAIF